MTRHQSPIDRRPFQAREAIDRQVSLEAQYGRVAIDEVAAALQHLRAAVAAHRETRLAARA